MHSGKLSSGGNVVITSGVNELPETVKSGSAAARFPDSMTFTEDNDPYEEHDFGIFELRGQTLYWKIDYFDPNLECRFGRPRRSSEDHPCPHGDARLGVLTCSRRRNASMRSRIIASSAGRRGWYFGRTGRFGDKSEMKGPYGSIASVTLMIARELLREIRKRDAPHSME